MKDIELFLDLEMTIFEDWNNPTPLHENISLIKHFCSANKISHATIFSAAIWDSLEKEKFEKVFQSSLEALLSLKLDVLKLEDAFNSVIEFHGISAGPEDFRDIFIFNPKRDLFKEWIFSSFKKGTFVLFDDTVEDEVILNGDLRLVFRHV